MIESNRNPKTKNNELIELLESIGIYIAYGSFSLMIIVILIAIIYHKLILKSDIQVFDPVNLSSILKFFQNFADFWTDLIFASILYFENRFSIIISIFALTFTILPFIISCIIAIYWIVRWRNWKQDIPIRLTNYLNEYDLYICGWTILAGFYAVIKLLSI